MTTKLKRQKKVRRASHDAGTESWNRIIKPFCDFAAANHGFVSAVARRIEADCGMKVKPQQVRGWLVSDEAERIEPRAGMAAILLDAAAATQREYVLNSATRAGMALKA